jgi:hypothetical protein
MKQPTVIDTIVKYSKDCIALRFILQHFVTSVRLIKSLPVRYIISEIDRLEEYATSLALRIDEKEKDIGKLIIPMLQGMEYAFGYDNRNKYSLTIGEMRDGYIMLPGEEYVILLRELDPNLLHFHYEPGILYKLDGELKLKTLRKLYSKQEKFMDTEILNLIINNKKKYEYIK